MCILANLAEGVLISDVITNVNGHHALVALGGAARQAHLLTHGLEEPLDGASLVPVHLRAQLDDVLAFGAAK